MTRLTLSLALAALAVGQTVEGPRFEVVSARLVDRTGVGISGMQGGPGTRDPGRVRFGGPISVLIPYAFKNLAPYQFDFPSWFNSTYVAIEATVPDRADAAAVESMWRNVLLERFHLKSHVETREVTAYDLAGSDPGKLKESSAAAPATTLPTDIKKTADGTPIIPSGFNANMIVNGGIRMQRVRTSMGDLAGLVSRDLNAPVSDHTGITGRYDFTLEYMPDRQVISSPAEAPPPPLRIALQEQLGMRLLPRKEKISILVVDSMDKLPTPN